MHATTRRGAAAFKVTMFWTTFVVGMVLGLAVLGTHPKQLAREFTASVAGVVLDEMAERGLIPSNLPQDPNATRDGSANAESVGDPQVTGQFGDAQASHTPGQSASSYQIKPRPQRSHRRADMALSATAQRTLEYWNALNDIMTEEEQLRRPPAQLSQANAEGFLTARIRASQFAARAMERLDRSGVDRDVVAHARDIATWYGQEVAIAQRGRALMGGSTGHGSATRSDTEDYKRDEKAHRQRVVEINNRSQTLRRQMIERYGIAFPVLK